jgi:hypothetical protein
MYFTCISTVSGTYYGYFMMVISMYLICMIDALEVLHLCFPQYSAHHLFEAQPIRESSFRNQRSMGLAPIGRGQAWHGSIRHAFWQTGHACSSMPCWVLSSRNHRDCWSGLHMGPLHSMMQVLHNVLLLELNMAQRTGKSTSDVAVIQ